MALVIHAPNVHGGGGATLLTALLSALEADFDGCLILDERMRIPEGLPDGSVVQRIRPTILGRLSGEWRLRKWVEANDVVLCFGNLPPLFKLRAKVLVFIQNRYQVESRSLKGFPLNVRIKILLEQFWFYWKKGNASRYIVQTPTMCHFIRKKQGLSYSMMPFVENSVPYNRVAHSRRRKKKAKYDFLYVSSGEPHKNHRNLVEAWALLAKEGIRPILCLTLDRQSFPKLSGWIQKQKKCFDLKIENAGFLSRQEIEGLYKEAKAFIYPSDFESLGLPIIEARSNGLPILAPEKDYVRDLIDPEQTFDPGSPTSIARAVKRFLKEPEESLHLMDAKTFLNYMLTKVLKDCGS
jgi:glycosyltransferase involved in cell wall biosynthesis